MNYSPETYKPDFELFGVMNLQKSVASENNADNKAANLRLVFGEISNEKKDEEDETLIQKSLDWDYFDKQGFIKYEHVEYDPDYIIGCPHRRITKNNRTVIKGAILKNKKMSDKVWELITSLEQHNRDFPDVQKTLGWSIEGSYTDGKEGKGGIRKARVVNVVITPNPVNKSTYLEMVEKNHKAFAKALSSTPVTTDLSEKTGGDAITKENIDDELKTTAEEPNGNKKKKSKNKINKSNRSGIMFKSLEEAKQHYLDHDVEEAEANRLAKALFPEVVDEGKGGDNTTDPNEKIIKSTIAESVSKSFKKFFPNKEEEIVEKSLQPEKADTVVEKENLIDTEGFVEVGDVLGTINKSLFGIQELVEQKVGYDFERDQELSNGLDAVANLEKSINTITDGMFVTVGEKKVPLAKAVEAVMKSRGSNINLDGENITIASDTIDAKDKLGKSKYKDLTWDKLSTKLTKGINDKKINLTQQVKAEGAFRTGDITRLDAILSLLD